MARKKRIELQGARENVKKGLKRFHKRESNGATKNNPAAQHPSPEAGGAIAILNLQRTIGNRAVGQLLKGALPAVQRDSFDEDHNPKDDKVANSSFTLNTGIYPGNKSGSTAPENTTPSMEAINTLGHEVGHIENAPASSNSQNDALAQEVGQIALGQGSPHDIGSSQTPVEQED